MNLVIPRTTTFGVIAAQIIFKCAAAVENSRIVDTVRKIAYPIFKATTSSYLLGFGSFEFSQTLINDHTTENQTIHQSALKSSKAYMYCHGGLIGSSGFCGILETVENFGIASLGSIGKGIFKAGNVFFLGANILALEENVRLYEAAVNSSDTLTDKEWHIRSAVSGIISNVGYILATSIFLLGGPAGIALAIGVIGASSGAFKILCDFILWKNEHMRKICSFDTSHIEPRIPHAPLYLPMQENRDLL